MAALTIILVVRVTLLLVVAAYVLLIITIKMVDGTRVINFQQRSSWTLNAASVCVFVVVVVLFSSM